MMDPELTDRARGMLLYPVWLLFLLTICLTALTTIPPTYQAVPLLVSIILLGLPHGAIDHRILATARGIQPSPRQLGRVALIYAGLGGAYLVLWTVAPVPAFIAFLLLTWFHWGQGDLAITDLLGDSGQERGHQALTILVRGGAPMILPLIAFPDQYIAVAGIVVSVIGTHGPMPLLETLNAPTARAGMLGLYLIGATALIGIESRLTDWRDWLHRMVDLTILTVFLLTVPPVLAIGIYFCAWHSLRHVFRYMILDSRTRESLQDGTVLPAIRRFVIEAAPLTLVSLGILALIYLLLPATAGIDGLIGTYLILLAVLTLPHTVIMIALDREQGLY
jgi:Brp/Blh family beta-carotene 15,15'-monooxygenase